MSASRAPMRRGTARLFREMRVRRQRRPPSTISWTARTPAPRGPSGMHRTARSSRTRLRVPRLHRLVPSGIDERLDGRIIERESSVDRGVRLSRPARAGIARTAAAGPAELPDDLGRAVHGRRAAAAAVDGTRDVAAVDPPSPRPAPARSDDRVDVVLGVDLGPEIRVADPIEHGAVGVGDGGRRPAEQGGARRRGRVQMEESEVPLLPGLGDRGTHSLVLRYGVAWAGAGEARRPDTPVDLDILRAVVLVDAMVGGQ